MDLTLVTFTQAPESALRGMCFSNAWAASPSYAQSRRAALTGQYPQRHATTRITDVFADAGWQVREDTSPTTEPTFRLLEQPDPQLLGKLSGVVAVCSLNEGNLPMSLWWPGVAESGTCRELVSPMDLAPTLAAIAGLDVRPNAALSFDGLNLVPVVRYGAAGHAALFFDNGVRMPDAVLLDDVATPPHARTRLLDEWQAWRGFMEFGPLQ
ncbi:hypothetical protein [Corynebacterium sp.]|uniref:hypothetical protein n=1 Tax=Corynebacterium sp. TaxID=1720 RepID=UPI0026DDC60E|nr:hypothetical protein [Corynebacterium sp.]MDO5032941.1 hypothetical protein [Corynebacterium sp.]